MRDASLVCAWSKCESEPSLNWLGRWLCAVHWRKVCGMLAKGHHGFVEAYDILRVPKKSRLHESSDGFGDLPDPNLFDYSA